MFVIVFSIFIALCYAGMVSTMLRIFLPIILLLLLLIYVKRCKYLWFMIIFIIVIYKNNIYMFLSILNIIKNHSLNRNTDKIMESGKFFMSVFNVKDNFEKLPSHPTIYVGNYPCTFLESVSLTLLPNITIAIGDSSITRNTWGKLLGDIIYRKQKDAYNDIKKDIKNRLSSGKSVFAYVTSRGEKEDIRNFFGRVRTGIFRIANEIGSTVTPIAFDTIKTIKGSIVDQDFNILVGDTVHVNDVDKVIRDTKTFFKNSIQKFRKLKG